MSDEPVTISQKEYDELVDDSGRLAALQGAGVDNWEGYGEAMKQYREWKRKCDSPDED